MTRSASAMPAEHAALVRRETISNTIATAVIAAIVTWLLFRGENDIRALAPPPAGIFGILPGTFNFTLLVTIALTFITRKRVSRAQFRRLGAHEGAALSPKLPANALARALVLAVGFTVICVPATYGLIQIATQWQWLPRDWSFAAIAAFFLLYFVLLSLAVTPMVVWRALRD